MSKLPSILIVEDDPMLVAHLSQHLSKEGFHISGTGESFKEIKSILGKQHVDIALVDIGLPGDERGGILIADHLAKERSTAVVYMTGDMSERTIEKVRGTRPASFLLKPLNMNQVVVQLKIVADNLKDGHQSFSEVIIRSGNIYIPGTKGFQRLAIEDIAYISADRNYSEIHLVGSGGHAPIKAWIHKGKIVKQLPTHFVDISRSIAVNLNHIELIAKDHILIDGQSMSLGEGVRSALLKHLNAVRTKK